jgi:hypothetical protein
VVIMRVRFVWVAVLVGAIGSPAYADSLDGPPRETPFDRGHVGLSIGAGEQTAFGHTRIGLGVGAGYFVLDGLELGAFALHEFGDGPSIDEVSPSLRYVAQPLVWSWPVIPYAEVFYSHWFLGDGNSDLDRVGTRAGLLRLSGRLIVGLGVVYEHTVSACATECDAVYPDVTFGFSF